MLKRYLLLTEKINNDWYPTFRELQEFLDRHDLEISGRTLQRDIRHIRNEYGIEIEYDRRHRGYRINREKSLDVNGFLRFMGLVRTADILTESLRDGRGAIRYLDFDSVHLFTGKEHIRDLLQAIRDCRIVGITHQKFDRDEPTHVTLQPYLLREYQYRWYLVGIPEGEREPKNYGLDRIQRLDVLPETFVRTREAYVREKFADTVGLTFSAGEPVAVTVRCTELTGKYLQTLPIHSSQEIVDSGGERWTVRYYVVPNFEFEQKLLMHLYQLEVVEPEWFRKAFGLRVREAVRVYESNGE
jgi:predicted DNA-binding transcriptional regulator YafY